LGLLIGDARLSTRGHHLACSRDRFIIRARHPALLG
jgi:hypothetical protein